MKDERSRLERRLGRLIAVAPLSPSAPIGSAVDITLLDPARQERLERLIA